MSDELKPVRCGCGGEAIIGLKEWEDRKGNYHENSFVYCNDCSISTGGYLTEAEAIEAWNTAMGTNTRRLLEVLVHDATDTNVGDKERTAKVEVVEKPNVYKCSECGQYFHRTSWGSPVDYCSRCGALLDWSGNE